jgi:osmotically inducible protein OsmC
MSHKKWRFNMKVLYSTTVTASGGRNGHIKSDDGVLDMPLSTPRSLGGSRTASNPEQLFAAGYGACFENAVLHIAQLKKVRLEKTTIAVKVDLQTFEDGHFNVGVAMDLDIQGVDDQIARQLIEAAHRVCPYSNATRGNIDLTISLRGERIV